MNDDHIKDEAGPEFLYQGLPAGYFEDEAAPTVAGAYRYIPFRGPGHYLMQRSIDAGEKPICSYRLDAVEIEFAVVRCTHYGELELDDFTRHPVG